MPLSNPEVRRQAADVLHGSEFQAYMKEQQSWDPLGWLMDKLGWLLHPRQHARPSDDMSRWNWAGFDPEVIRVLLYVGLGLVVVVLLYLFVQWILGRKQDALPPERVTEVMRAETQASYATLAAEAAAKNDYRLAIHYLFLATVSQVIRESDFHASDIMTNREIAAASDFSRFAQGGVELRNVFHAMVHQDEPFWFGGVNAASTDYDAFNENYQRFTNQVGRYAS